MPPTPVTCEYPESAAPVKIQEGGEIKIEPTLSDKSLPKTKLSELNIICRGISNIKALLEGADQPATDIEMAFYKAYK